MLDSFDLKSCRQHRLIILQQELEVRLSLSVLIIVGNLLPQGLKCLLAIMLLRAVIVASLINVKHFIIIRESRLKL